MVSGFFTSPYDHARIISGEASPILIESKCSTGACCLKSFNKSFISYSWGAPTACPSSTGAPGKHSPCSTVKAGPSIQACFSRVALVLLQLHVDAERADLLHEHVEGFRHSGVHLVIAVDDVLVHLRAA